MSSAKSLFVTLPVCATAIICAAALTRAGNLTPPGAPAPTMKTLDEVEARIPIGPDTTPGDLDSVYKITQSGSYYLTDHLFAEPGKRGLEINANFVAVDLNGYTLFGAGGTDGVTVGTSDEGGISFPQDGVVVRNGFIQGWGSNGVFGAFNLGRLEDLIIDSCAEDGIAVPPIVGLSIVDCVVTRSGLSGILNEGVATTIAQTRIVGNAGRGVESTGEGLDISDCLIAQNGQGGVDLVAETRIRDAYIAEHETDPGVRSTAPLHLTRSMITRTGSGQQVFVEGVRMLSESVLTENYIRPTLGTGILVDGDNNWIDRNGVYGSQGVSVDTSDAFYSTFITRNYLENGTNLVFTGGTFILPPGAGQLLAPDEVETNDRPHSNYEGETEIDPG